MQPLQIKMLKNSCSTSSCTAWQQGERASKLSRIPTPHSLGAGGKECQETASCAMTRAGKQQQP